MLKQSFYFILPVALFVLSGGCSNDEKAQPSGPQSDVVSITGEVTRVLDGILVDGDAVLDVEVDGGKTEEIYLPSLWAGPWTQEQEASYQVFKQVQIGDSVRVEGTRINDRIEVTKLEIL